MDLVNQPPSQKDRRYDVFLSFRGKDTWTSYTSHLYLALCNAEVDIFKGYYPEFSPQEKDDFEHGSGDYINNVLQAIRCSKISIIIFSRKYAGSKWCLEELSTLMELYKSNGWVILPVFYGVDPSEVRHQTSSFGEGFSDLVQRISPPKAQVSKWRTALATAGGISGLVVLGSRYESETVEDVVKHVCDILDKKDLLVTNHPVGVDDRVQEVITMLKNHRSEDVVMVGIWGMGGIGKTVVAEAIYNKIGHTFDSKSFLSNIRETWNQEEDQEVGQKDGQVYLQNQILSGICKTREIMVNSIELGKITLRDKLHHKKVLLVLDDVDESAQLNALVGSRDWFRPGSMIIITTRDKRLLYEMDCCVYEMKTLDERESMEHFSWQAFKQEIPKEGFVELSRIIVAYSGGLPLALEILGSSLFGREVEEWESVIDKLKRLPNSMIHRKLMITYYSLDDDEKEIFINIVLFYVGEDMNDVIERLNGRGCNASIGMRVLIDRSLVTIDKNNKLRMHNLLQATGREIIRESSENDLHDQGHRYEVFLSFRGEDSRRRFTSHIFLALRNAGIVVFKDDVEIRRGNHTKLQLLQVIGSSKIAIIIFSKEYAGSKWCLEELSIIMELHKSNRKVVLPVFYDVDPSEIRNQTSYFGEAFRDLIQRTSPSEPQVSNWRTSLVQAARISGIIVLGSRDESENVKEVVETVCDILDKKDLFVANHPVGVYVHVQEVITMLQNLQFKEDVVMVGIWGMSGIGKTTIAKAIYNEIGRNFDSRIYLPKIRKVWHQKDGKVRLQNQFLSEICKPTKMEIDCIDSGKNTLRDRLHHKKALVVLDDVDELVQLQSLVGSRDRFISGSIIIITTTNKHLLDEMECHVYEMKNLDQRESMELFSWHAFRQESPKEGFIELSRDIVAYSGGIPFALEILGSDLFDREVEEWETVLDKLKRIPHDKIHRKLAITYYSLDDCEKEIFINIVLFYIGEDKNDVIERLDGRGLHASIRMGALIDRSLVTIDKNNKLRMHNLLQAMGREIIRESSENDLQDQDHRYEVFLSFRGEDSRATFTSHLYSALRSASIVVFKDDVELPRGNHIKTELLQAIGSSKIAIIIFSKEYAGSKWCLEELSIIMGLHRSNRKVVLPVFYDVDPSEIRNQTSYFGKAFRDLIQSTSPSKHQVSNWRASLIEVGGIAGMVVLGSRDESEKVKEVVGAVCDLLDKKDLSVADHPVGLDNRVQGVISMLQNLQFKEDVVMAGIWGMSGIGKTTIAKAIYNEIGRDFDSRIYLPKIRKVWHQKEGKVRLQNQLLSKICKPTKMEIDCIDSGKNTLRDRLRHKKALVVLDGVDKLAQLKALVGSRDWFKSGSIIIITTTNKRLLHEMGCHVYEVENLDQRESMELFSWHAFKQKIPKEGFVELSRIIVAYSGGLPLALEILGSYLFDREVNEWESVLDKLKKIPDDKIQKKLRISFDGLNKYYEREIFLDICCFFIGMDIKDVTQILNGCGFFADSGIKTLVERSLVTINEKNMLGMHDLLRDMGREIIREESEMEFGKRSRLWSHEDAMAVLQLKHKATEAIEGLSLDMSQNEKMQFKTEAFKNMTRLRLLRLGDVELRGDCICISGYLTWFCWYGFPLKYIPSNFYQRQLVAIDLKCSNLRQVWKKPELLEKLKILNLSHSPFLVQTPDFSKLPNLEKLILRNCRRLSEIHHSIGLLDELLLLDLEDCTGLRSLPRSIYRLKRLNTLILSGCLGIEKLEEDIEQMESLTTLIAPPSIKRVPFSLVRLKSIQYISICGHDGSSSRVIPSLFRSWTSPANNPLSLIPTLPSSVLGKMLNWIRVRLSTIPDGVPKQQSLLLEDGLQTPNSLCGTTKCKDASRLENCLGHHLIQIGNDAPVFRILSNKVSQGLKNLTKNSDDCILPDDNYPYWLAFKGEGASVQFEVPLVNGHHHLKGMVICCVYIPSSDFGTTVYESCILSGLMIINYTKRTTLLYTEDKLNSLEETERKEIISNLECDDDQVEVKAAFASGLTVKKMAVYLIYDESLDEQMKPSSSGTKHKCEEEWGA